MIPTRNVQRTFELEERNILNNSNYNTYSSSINQYAPSRDLVYNNSAVHDKYIHTYKISSDTTPRNNYTTFQNQLSDSIGTYNQHPVARYVNDKIPFYTGMISNDKPLVDLANAQEKYIHTCDLGTLDIVKTSKNAMDKFIDDYTVQTTYPDKDEVGTMRKRELNNTFIDRLMYKYSNIQNEIEDRKRSNAGYINENNPTIVYRNNGTTKERFKEPLSLKSETFKEPFARKSNNVETNVIDDSYLLALESKIIAVLHYLKSDPHFSFWKRNWELMEKGLKRDGFTFKRLEESDADIAYVINKGEQKRFRIRSDNYKYIPLNVSQYVLYHECAHLANPKYGHGKEFCELLSLICLAAFQCNQINIEKLTPNLYTTRNQPIVCRGDMKSEILSGIEHVLEHNHDESSVKYFKSLAKIIESK